MDNFLARQAIFDRRQNVYAYELLFRSGSTNGFDGTDATFATSHVIANSVFSMGLENIQAGKRVFVNFGHQLLLGEWTTMLPSSSTVIEVLETVEPDSDVLEACRNLRRQGYLVALDDFVCDPRFEPLTDLADFIKVDVRTTSREEQVRMLSRYGDRGVKMLAEKVETHEEFEWSLNAGYDYFQGYFFAKPVVMKGRQVPGVKTNHLRLLEQLQQPDLDFVRLERIISEDVSFSYRVIRYVNSGVFANSTPIQSIRRALINLGERETRKWISLATFPALARDKPSELISHAMLRARFCELLAEQVRPKVDAADASLMGMFSMLDAMIDRPLGQIISEMKLTAVLTEALLTPPHIKNKYSLILRLVQHYEEANWDVVRELACDLEINTDTITPMYLDALRWSVDLFRDATAKEPAAVH